MPLTRGKKSTAAAGSRLTKMSAAGTENQVKRSEVTSFPMCCVGRLNPYMLLVTKHSAAADRSS